MSNIDNLKIAGGGFQKLFSRTMPTGLAAVRTLSEGEYMTSESQSYAACLAVQFQNQAWFDGIIAFALGSLQRKNIQGETQALNLFAWEYDYNAGKIIDGANALDADSLIALSLFWAQGLVDAGIWKAPETSYKSIALAIGADIKKFGFVVANGKAYPVADFWESIKPTNAEQATSYIITLFYRMMFQYTGDTFWTTEAIEGSLDSYEQSQTSPLGAASSAKLPPDWDIVNNGVLQLDSGRNHDNYISSDYQYNAIRTPVWQYLEAMFYDDPRFLALLTGGFYDTLSKLYKQYGKVPAEIHHDGSVTNLYENSLMSACNSLVFTAKKDPVADTIYEKVMGGFVNSPVGAYYSDNMTQTGTFSLYSDFWTIIVGLIREGMFTMYGATGVTPLPTSATSPVTVPASPSTTTGSTNTPTTETTPSTGATGVSLEDALTRVLGFGGGTVTVTFSKDNSAAK